MNVTRVKILTLLGGHCIRCGVDDSRCLQIDHVQGDGNKERKATGSNPTLKQVKATPDRYQLLCANCNWIKRHTDNECGRVTYVNLRWGKT